jgi:hypothetical protein
LLRAETGEPGGEYVGLLHAGRGKATVETSVETEGAVADAVGPKRPNALLNAMPCRLNLVVAGCIRKIVRSDCRCGVG